MSFKRGDHLVSFRGFYDHHGIYVGGGQVIHYTGMNNGEASGPIKLTSLKEFRDGRNAYMRKRRDHAFKKEVVVARAYERVGEDGYDIFSNNCEHFANWCVYGTHYSKQSLIPGLIQRVLSTTVALSR